MFGIRGLIVLAFAVLGLAGVIFASNTLRDNALESWHLEAKNTAESLSDTLLSWLEESYAPLSGLAVLTENSDEVDEPEFLNAFDGLEARATAFFLESAALAQPDPRAGGGWRIKYSTDPEGSLRPDEPLAGKPQLLEALAVADARFGELILSRPLGSNARVSPVTLGTFAKGGEKFVIVGLVNYGALIKGLFDLHVPSGVTLHVNGRFPKPKGQSAPELVFIQRTTPPAYAVTTRTVSAGAELAVTWNFDTAFSGGPSHKLANLTMFTGLTCVTFISLFVAMLMQANQTIALKVERATRELSEKEALLRMALDNMPGGMIVVDENLDLVLVNDQYKDLYGDSGGLVAPGASITDVLDHEIGPGYISGEGDPAAIREARLATFKSPETVSLHDTAKGGRLIQVIRKPAPNGYSVSVATDITETVEAQRGAKLLAEAMDTFSDMVILYDKDEKVTFTNDRYHEIYPDSPPKGDITHFTMEQLMRRSLESGLIDAPLAKTDPEAWLAQSLASRRNKDGGSGETTHASGRTYFYRYDWTTEGGLMLVQIDITDRKKAEKELADKQAQLDNILSHVQQGIVLFDERQRLIAWNPHYPDTLNIDEELLNPGLALYDLALILASRGDYGDEDAQQLARARADQLAEGEFRSDISFGDERIFDSQSTRAEDGSLVITYTDITERKAAERLIADANKMINESIQYASRIQRSVLPSDAELDAAFSAHMVIWEPRDVVGGDIYHLRRSAGTTYLMVTDCTGHGVPGAFMTMIATGALDQALIEVPDGEPAAILGRVHQLVKRVLGQDSDVGESDDGFECGMCRIEAGGSRLSYAGARFELWTVNGGELTATKGDKAGIGYRRTAMDQVFTNHRIAIKSTTAFYLSTDGLIDQIGGAKRRAFGKRRLKDAIMAHQEMTLPDQALKIRQAFDAFQGDEGRRDDITLVGFIAKQITD